ncbi:MAG: hypothetical protein D6782_08720, partial [Alphaproteobacteria bacterium]
MQGCLFAILCGLIATQAVARDPLVSDLSQRRVDIRYSFAGADLLLFGAVTRDAALPPGKPIDVIAVVRGPVRSAVVRRKERVFGIWINATALRYETAPGYYAVAANRPLADILDARTRALHQIGLDTLQLSPSRTKEMSAPEEDAFRAGLIRHRAAEGLFKTAVVPLEILGDTLFRTRITLPSGVPIGPYRADVFLAAEGRLIGRTTLRLTVDKSGFERFMFDMAQTRPMLYGTGAVVF